LFILRTLGILDKSLLAQWGLWDEMRERRWYCSGFAKYGLGVEGQEKLIPCLS